MNEIILYLFKSSLILTGFYLFYKFFLDNDTHYGMRRGFLLLSMITAILTPMIPFGYVEYQSWENVLYYLIISGSPTEGGELVEQITPIIQSWSWTDYAGLIYALGVAVMLIRLIWIGIQLAGLFAKAEFTEFDGRLITYSPEVVIPFSFFHYIFLPAFEEGEYPDPVILTHEGLHIQKRHSWDVILSEVILLVFWFNPISWLFKKALQEVHEYQVDAQILDAGFDKKAYQLLLLNYSVGKQKVAIANSFNQLTTKKRISMMNKRKSSRHAMLKYLSFLPIAFLSLTLMSSSPVPALELQSVKQGEGWIVVGKVLDKNNEEALVGATVIVKGTQVGTVTDQYGIFQIEIPNEPPADLIISYIGYEKYEVAVAKSGELTVNLSTDTGSSSHSFKELSILVKSNKKGDSVVIRSNDSSKDGLKPLYVIDGEIVTIEISELKPDDIASINVLKGEAAAKKYGKDGANGVIEITMKKK
ncbi:MAG: carboxypeptidase-like regulatory domain-containing protein [Bacteroidia bacterium]|nr:carboxypeptidase-like regulatory domain-containing protein [Bacteroidia bacterium]